MAPELGGRSQRESTTDTRSPIVLAIATQSTEVAVDGRTRGPLPVIAMPAATAGWGGSAGSGRSFPVLASRRLVDLIKSGWWVAEAADEGPAAAGVENNGIGSSSLCTIGDGDLRDTLAVFGDATDGFAPPTGGEGSPFVTNPLLPRLSNGGLTLALDSLGAPVLFSLLTIRDVWSEAGTGGGGATCGTSLPSFRMTSAMAARMAVSFDKASFVAEASSSVDANFASGPGSDKHDQSRLRFADKRQIITTGF
jgi:hypothetical protein